MEISIDKSNGNSIIDFGPVFELLNKELVKIDESLILICAGGYVMQAHGYRATSDIDAFYKNSAEIEKAIRMVGDEFGINKVDELWLNDSISNMNPEPPAQYCTLMYMFSNLEVKIIDILYLMGMKLTSVRELDLMDVSAILKHDNNRKPFELLEKLNSMGFSIDISVLLDVFGRAHGIDWLDDFYRRNESELIEYF
jgi:hypothetical protein